MLKSSIVHCIDEFEERATSSTIGGKQLQFRNFKYLSIIQMHMFFEIIHLQNYSISFDKVLLLLSHSQVQLFATPWTAACQAPILHYLPEFAQIHTFTESVITSNHLIL